MFTIYELIFYGFICFCGLFSCMKLCSNIKVVPNKNLRRVNSIANVSINPPPLYNDISTLPPYEEDSLNLLPPYEDE